MSHYSDHRSPSPEDPTPEEIRRRSAEIRRGWSRRVAARRRVMAQPTWLPPLILGFELAGVLNDPIE